MNDITALDTKFNALLREQIRSEFSASQQYVAIAVYFDGNDLPRLAAHFYAQAVEERNHAMMLVQYLLDRDADVEIPGTDPELRAALEADPPPGLAFTQPSQANAIFATIPGNVADRIRARVRFYDWDRTRGEVRWMTAWDTTTDDVDEFVAIVREELGR